MAPDPYRPPPDAEVPQTVERAARHTVVGMDLGLDGVVALVVGGAGLIGPAVGAPCTPRERVVVLAGRTPETLDAAAAAIDPSVGTVVLDAGDDASVTRRSPRSSRATARSASSSRPPPRRRRTLDPARDRDPAQVLGAFEAKAMGALRVANAVLPHMTEAGYGRVVTVSGQNAYLTGSVTGSVRNAAVVIASKGLADAVAGSGVTVNVVNPGVVTPDPETEVQPGAPGQSSPDQVAAVVTFLVSRAAGAVSGEAVAVGHRVRGSSAF